jgi:hypothetical protein
VESSFRTQLLQILVSAAFVADDKWLASAIAALQKYPRLTAVYSSTAQAIIDALPLEEELETSERERHAALVKALQAVVTSGGNLMDEPDTEFMMELVNMNQFVTATGTAGLALLLDDNMVVIPRFVPTPEPAPAGDSTIH